MNILLRLLQTYPRYDGEIVKALRNLSPMGVRMAANTGHLNQAIAWYFGPYHRDRILTKSGLRTGLLLVDAWLRNKFSGKA